MKKRRWEEGGGRGRERGRSWEEGNGNRKLEEE